MIVMKRFLILLLFLLLLCGCTEKEAEPVLKEEEKQETTADKEDKQMRLEIEANGQTLYADFADNSSAQAFKEKLKEGAIRVALEDYGNFEKVGDLPWNLPRNDTNITTIPGDVILYQGNMITIYYSENTWSFTYLARIPDATKESLLEVLGQGDVEVTFRLCEE